MFFRRSKLGKFVKIKINLTRIGVHIGVRNINEAIGIRNINEATALD